MDDTPTPIAEIDHGPSKFEVFLEENQKLLMTLAIVIFLGVLGYVGYTGYSDMIKAQAGEALTAAVEPSELEAVISQHGNTASAGAASLLLASTKAEESNEKAIAELQNFISTYPNHPAIPTATTSLGLRLLNEGKLPEAEAQLASVLDMDNAEFITPAAQIGLGDIAQQNNDIARAKEYYTAVTDLITDSDAATNNDTINKFSAYKSIASDRLRFLGANAPKEVEKKVTPAPAETPQPQDGNPSDASTPNTPAEPAAEESATSEEKDEKNSQVAE
ncbi:tetratricopeptide repeat protein [Rubritalea tangerina]|uniref:Tetratricopeptide repeat protein n=1 Tax=Rubritalea tangerina TaxID=430798 RepID=A0ABW4ZF15_9BACT